MDSERSWDDAVGTWWQVKNGQGSKVIVDLGLDTWDKIGQVSG